MVVTIAANELSGRNAEAAKELQYLMEQYAALHAEEVTDSNAYDLLSVEMGGLITELFGTDQGIATAMLLGN